MVQAMGSVRFGWSHSLKTQRDETDFRKTQGLMNALHERENQGEHELYYFDESGFRRRCRMRGALSASLGKSLPTPAAEG